MLRIAAAAAAAATASAAAAAPSLYDTLTGALFLNSGTHTASDAYTWGHVSCLYLEPQNVSCAKCSWGQSGSCALLSLATPTPPPSSCNVSAPSPGTDRPGGDLQATPMPSGLAGCQAACCAADGCVGYVFVPSAPGDFMGCAKGQPCCYLKGAAVDPVNSTIPGIVSGAVARPPGVIIAPPLGARNAVPLGGVGAGSVELRGDGRFAEVTIVNQSPGGAAKHGVLADALLGLRLGAGGAPRAVRTAPPPGVPGVASITYSGAFPLSRLAVSDPSLPAGASPTLFAHHRFVPGDKVASGLPAIGFTLAVSNPGATPMPVSLALALPWGGINDCARTSTLPPVGTPAAGSPAECAHACGGAPGCASWTFRDAPAPGCTLNADIPHSVHAAGATCGVAGSWAPTPGGGLTLRMYPGGPLSNASAGNPAAGDITVAPVLDAAGGGVTGLTAAGWVGDSIGDVWAAWAGGAPPSPAGAVGTHGLVGVSGTLPPGANGTLSLVWAWYFPNRDHVGANIGNFYAGLFPDSEGAAAELAAPGALQAAAGVITGWHGLFSGALTGGPGVGGLPEWLVDHAWNAFSHHRSVIWTRDGRWRQWEAYDCPDVDSQHNDYQRHLVYTWLWPDNEAQKMAKWASGQVLAPGPDYGQLPEYLGSFDLGPLDIPGGRVMADTTSIWVVQLLEMWRATGDADLLAAMYPTAAAAVAWQVARANRSGIGLPDHLVNTYDITNPQDYPATTFNALVYLASMKAGAELADAAGDAATAATARAAFAIGANATVSLLWNASAGYFTGFSGAPGTLHTDCLYGQVLASYLGLGWLVDPAQVASHLKYELATAGNAYGLRVVMGRPAAPESVDMTNWMGAAPDWSALAVALGQMPLPDALAPAQAELENMRTRVNSLWDIPGLVSGEWGADAQNGQPQTTSHYGFALTFYYLLPALAGQFTDVPGGRLTFAPAGGLCAGGGAFSFPWFTAGVGGTVSRAAGGAATFTVAFGSLVLPPGGLAVCGSAYAGAVDLGPGGSVTW